MSVTGLKAFDTTIQLTHEWLNQIQEETGLQNRHRAYLFLRETLHATRDRMTNEEAIHLGAQLPMLIRGIYYDGWTLREAKLRQRAKGLFFADVSNHFPGDSKEDVEEGVRAVFHTLAARITEGEFGDIRSQLPEEVRNYMPETVA